MPLCDNKKHTWRHPHEDSHLLKITPSEIAEWMACKAFGTQFSGPSDRPLTGRAGSLEFYKKATSYSMPNKITGCNAHLGWGNPTKSLEVNGT
jgi:hypothetical protein